MDPRRLAASRIAVAFPVLSFLLVPSGGAPNPQEEAPSTAQDISELVQSLRDQDPNDREAAVRALASVGAAARPAIPGLVAALQDEVPTVRAAAAAALGTIGPEESEIHLMVRTINLARDFSKSYGDLKLRGIAQVFHEDWPYRAGLVGVSDPARSTNCLSSPEGVRANATKCLASEMARLFDVSGPPLSGIKSDQTTEGQADKGGDVGAIVGPEWSVVGREAWKLGYNCYCPLFRVRNWGRKLLELVLEHQSTKDTLRFYTIYFYSGDSDEAANLRTLQAQRASKIIRDRARPGELPPIVVGDFNARRYFGVRTSEQGCLCTDNGEDLFFPGDEFVSRPRECVEFCELQGYKRGVVDSRVVVHDVAEESVTVMEQHFWRPIDVWREKYPDQVSETGIDIIYIGKRESFTDSRDVTIVPVQRHDIEMKQRCSVEGHPDFSGRLTDHDIAAGFRLKVSPAGTTRPIVVPSLARALTDEDPRVREAASEALGRLGPSAREALPALVEGLSDENVNVRRASLLAFGAIGPEARDVIPAVTEALDDESAIVREAVPDVLEKIQGGLASVTPSFSFHDASGLATVSVIERRDACLQYHDGFRIPVPPDMIAIGGGAMGARIPEGAFLTASYPSDELDAWIVSSQDHVRFNRHHLTGYAIGLKIEGMSRAELMDAVRVSTAESRTAKHPEASVAVPEEFVLVGGGFRIETIGDGNLATASFPPNERSWSARSKDHVRPSPAKMRVYAVGIKKELPVGEVLVAIRERESTPEHHPAATVQIAPGFVLTGGGAEVDWHDGGNLLWKLQPVTTATAQSFSTASKDHVVPDPSTITTYALAIQILMR